jgi:propionyl-CoA synthetase
MGFVVLKADVTRPETEITAELIAPVYERIGPVAAFKDASVVARLAKTRSGKILRASIRKIADGEETPIPQRSTTPDELRAVLAG